MRIGATTILSLVACALIGACGSRPGAESASDLQLASLGEPAIAALVVGCWNLSWDPGPGGSAARVGTLPDSVRLREEVVFGTRERLVSPATHPAGRAQNDAAVPPWEARFVVNRWWVDDDSLRVRFYDGERDEWNVTLGIDPGELLGSARYHSDPEPGGGPVQAGVRAARIDCPF